VTIPISLNWAGSSIFLCIEICPERALQGVCRGSPISPSQPYPVCYFIYLLYFPMFIPSVYPFPTNYFSYSYLLVLFHLFLSYGLHFSFVFIIVELICNRFVLIIELLPPYPTEELIYNTLWVFALLRI
jgi:hypothetical protein